MSEEVKDESPPSDAELEAQEKALKKLLSTPPPPEKSILQGVQKKIRARSKGKFYSDGWSVEGGRINYMLVAVIMLVVLAIAYVALAPTGISR
jgi:hypothetical protein